MNLPNKITLFRIVLAFIVIILLLFPFDATGFNMPQVFVNEKIVIDVRYLIAGVLFVIASVTDFLDGYLARKNNQVTEYGKMMDAIADKILVNAILIILSAQGFIHPIIPVVIIVRDTIVNSIKMVAGNSGHVVAAIKLGKVKTVCLMLGVALTLFYNMPFELFNFRVSDFLLILAAILSVVSAIQYYNMNKKYLFKKAEI